MGGSDMGHDKRQPERDAEDKGRYETALPGGRSARGLGASGWNSVQADEARTRPAAAQDAEPAMSVGDYKLRDLVNARQADFKLGVSHALANTMLFADAVSKALGSMVSRDEAIDALKREVGEQLERLR